MADIASKIFRGDRVIWMIFLFLCLISIIEVYSASSQLTFNTNYWRPILKHTGFLAGGLFLILIINIINPKHFKHLMLLIPLMWALLIALQFIGHSVNGANRYLFGFQPSEFIKLGLITGVAYILSGEKLPFIQGINSFKWIWILAAITCFLIVRDNFSTAALLYIVVGIMLFIGQTSFKKMALFIFITVTCIVLLFSFIWFFPDAAKNVGLKRAVVWVERIKNYKEQPQIAKNDKIPDDMFQPVMAKIAIAQGGIVGKMPGNSHLSDFLPQAYSDFIYAIIIEETGIIGGIFVLALYVFLFIRAGTIASRCTKLFPKFLVMGSALMIVVQAMVNMAVSVGLMPVTGQPLPLISKGGSSVLVTCIFIGIMLSVSRFENPVGVMQEEAFDKEFEEERRLANENEQLEVGVVY